MRTKGTWRIQFALSHELCDERNRPKPTELPGRAAVKKHSFPVQLFQAARQNTLTVMVIVPVEPLDLLFNFERLHRDRHFQL